MAGLQVTPAVVDFEGVAKGLLHAISVTVKVGSWAMWAGAQPGRLYPPLGPCDFSQCVFMAVLAVVSRPHPHQERGEADGGVAGQCA